MKIANVGYNYCHAPGFCVDRPYGSGDHLLLIIKSEAFFWLRGEKVIVPPNSVIIFKKGTTQLYGAVSCEYVNDWIHFDIDEQDEQFFSDLGISFDTVIPLYNVTELVGFIKHMYFELYSQNLRKKATMQKYFELLLLKLSENIHQQNIEHDHPYYHSFCTLRNKIQLAPQKAWSIDEIRKTVHLSRSYVQHLYKLFFNTSIISDVQKYRMEHAKYLLVATDTTVSAIAQDCGYDSDVHFMRIFKKVTGMTPTEFRSSFHISLNETKKSTGRPSASI